MFPTREETMEALVVVYWTELGTMTKVSRALDIDPSTLFRWLNRWEE